MASLFRFLPVRAEVVAADGGAEVVEVDVEGFVLEEDEVDG